MRPAWLVALILLLPILIILGIGLVGLFHYLIGLPP